MSHKSIGNRIRQKRTSHQRELVVLTQWYASIAPGQLVWPAHDLALSECITPPSSAERLIRRSNDVCRGRNERGRHRAKPEYHRATFAVSA